MVFRIILTAMALVVTSVAWAEVKAEGWNIPTRSSPRPLTTDGVPHIQIGVESKPALMAALLRRVAIIPHVEIRETIVSLPGAKGFWLRDDLPLAHPEVIVRGREFAHIHPDGSLHASLPVDIAESAVDAGWAIKHPWADERSGWGGFVMIYTAQSEEELEVVFQLILASYNFVTGENITVTGG